MKKLLVTGGSGDLGRSVCEVAQARGYEVTATYLHRPERIKSGMPLRLDLTDREAVKIAIERVEPDAVIHTANPPLNAPNLRQSIVSAAYHLSSFCPKQVRLILLSTDMVFDGMSAPYADDDPPSPLSTYGQAKAEMEMMSDYVVRTSLIYDFVAGNKQADWMLDKLAKNEPLRLFRDELRSAIWVDNLAEAIIELVTSPMFKGVLNVAAPEAVSRLELGKKILTALGHVDVPLEAISQAHTGRPANLTLDVQKAQLLLKTRLLTLDESFAAWQQRTAQLQA
ncbi:MAG: SDR family oxidoreductase [Anaerolineae bacterium]